MRRTETININGVDYTLCYSTRTVRAVTEKFGSPGMMDYAMRQSKSAVERVDALLFVLHELLISGARFLYLTTGEKTEPPTLLEIYAAFPRMNYNETLKKVTDAITAGSFVSTEIKQKPAKGKKKSREQKLPATIDRYIWYGLHVGLDYNTALDIPHGELLSLINEEQIQTGVADPVIKNSDEDPFPDWE